MPVRPVLAGEIAAAVAVQKLDDAMPPAQDVATNGLATAQQIPDAFLGFVGHMDGGQLAGAEQPDELRGIPPSVLMRWPGRRGVNAGAMTWQGTPSAVIWR